MKIDAQISRFEQTQIEAICLQVFAQMIEEYQKQIEEHERLIRVQNQRIGDCELEIEQLHRWQQHAYPMPDLDDEQD